MSKVDLSLQQFIGQFFGSYRVIEGPRGWLDLLAGFRYTYLGEQVGLQANNMAIDGASTQLVNQIAQQVATPGSDLRTLIQQNIVDKLGALNGSNPKLPYIEKVAEGVGADKRIGRSFLNAGLGYGGSCFPKDVAAFISISEQIGEPFPLLREVQRILALVKRRDPDVARSPCSDLRFHLRSTSVFCIASQRPVSRAAKSAC